MDVCVCLLTASLVTMARIIERTQRYILILSPPNRFCIYSGIVYTYKKNTVLDSEGEPISYATCASYVTIWHTFKSTANVLFV